MENKRLFGDYFYNPISYLGVLLSVLVVIVELFLFGMDFFAHGQNLYLGLITYLVVPGFLALGLLLIPLGALWTRHRRLKNLPTPDFRSFRIDLGSSSHRNMIMVFISGTTIVLLMTIVGTYQAFHYTESVAFCGTLCHKVMSPEFTVYKESPHGKVECVECHIGAGADWFIKAKLSGLRQVYHAMLGTYSNPIKTPVHNLRPAEDTCMECHWPGKFFSTLDFKRTYYLPEKDNKPWVLRMNLNVGGGSHADRGVHAHMNIENEIYYVSDDEERQKMIWVKSVAKDGSERIFTSKDSKYKETPPPADLVRKMDCIDCHNRPTHQFLHPDRLMNEAFNQKRLDVTLPDLKERAVEALNASYTTLDEAKAAIRKSIEDHYQSKYPELVEPKRAEIQNAISVIQSLYALNFFPEMHARWDTHPDNIGHLYSKGCFRCHDNKHKDSEGEAIANDCNTCHTIIEQGPLGATKKNLEGLEYLHPDGDEEWKDTACTKCHT